MNTKQTTFHVQGMGCGSCIQHVRQALAFEGIVEVHVRLREGKVVVAHVPELPTEQLVAALGRAGYPARAA
jgi:Cu+-exporting ATPase